MRHIAEMQCAFLYGKQAPPFWGGAFYVSKPSGFPPYTVKVSVTELRIRSGPGTDNASNGFIAPGVYTIVEEADGQGAKRWGKLKSGAGWISLDYATKC